VPGQPRLRVRDGSISFSSRSSASARSARARTLAGLAGRDIREHTRAQDPAMALAAVIGEMQFVLRELAGIAERAGSGRR